MALTAREWLLLPEDEQRNRANELSSHECFELRMTLSYIHFSEEQKKSMTEDEKYRFCNPPQRTEEEINVLRNKHNAIFEQMIKEVEEKRNKQK